MTIREGDTLNVTCEGIDDTLEWRFDGASLKNNSGGVFINSEDEGSGMETSLILIIKNVTYPQHEGTYICIATSSNTTVVNTTVIITG